MPKLLDGRKHRLYFFTDWEYTLNHANAPFTTTVPTTAELNGDFSGLSPVGMPTAPIYDPLTTTTVGKVTSRTQFKGNIIPQSRMDPIGRNIAAFFPAPNCTPTPTSPFNYCSNPISATSYLYNADRVDYNASDYDHIWAKFSRDGPRNQPTINIPNVANTSAYGGWTDDHYEISWSHIFSPSFSNEARVGYVSEVNFASPLPADAGSIGLQGVPLTQFPTIKTNQYASFGAGGYSRTRDGHYILNDAMVLQMGRHTLSIGGEFMRYAYSSYKPGVLSGSYSFTGGFTAVPGQLLLPYPQYPVDQVIEQNVSNGSVNFNSFNARIQRRLTHGLSLLANYTWSRNIEQDSLLNESDAKYEKRISSFDYPQHLVISFTYKLPSSAFSGDGIVGYLQHALLGGWATSGTYLLQSGAPLSWGNVVYLGGELHF